MENINNEIPDLTPNGIEYVKRQMDEFANNIISPLNDVIDKSYVFNPMERGVIVTMAEIIKHLTINVSNLIVYNVELSSKLAELIDESIEESIKMSNINREIITFSLMSIMLKNKQLDMYTPEEFVKCAPDDVFKDLIKLCPTLVSEDGPYGNLVEVRNKHTEETANIELDM